MRLKSEPEVVIAAAELEFVWEHGAASESVVGLESAPELVAEAGLGTGLVEGLQSAADSGLALEIALEPGSVLATELEI